MIIPTIKELAETGSASVQGTSIGTVYGLQPIQFGKEVVDAAKKQLFFANFCRVIQAPEGVHDVIIPKRGMYEGRSGMSFDTTERTSGDITWTTMDNLESVTATPSLVLAGYAITKTALRTNALNLIEAAKEELSYAIGDKLDYTVATTLGDATVASNSVRGAQTLYGGDATSAATLESGDTITTDLLAKAARYLKDTKMYYRASGAYGNEALSAVSKNPWQNTPDDPFVFFIGPAQEEKFRKDSQFVNAAEYGSNIVVQNGEIGQYLGIRIVVTTNVESVAASSTAPDGTTAAVNMTRCILAKMKAACAIVWGRQPEIKVWDYNERDQVRISLVCEYCVKVIHPDAIVFIDVADV